MFDIFANKSNEVENGNGHLSTDKQPIYLLMRYNAHSCAHWLGIWCIIPLYKGVNMYIVPFLKANTNISVIAFATSLVKSAILQITIKILQRWH